MKANKKFSLAIVTAAMVMFLLARAPQLRAQTGAAKSDARQWSVQVDKVDPGDVNIGSAFQIAIYENMLVELDKTKQFKQVFRDGDRDAVAAPDLLILKIAVQKYTAGSETKRAVTTVTGATKINVRSQLCTRDGRVVLERVVNGNVRFFGSNLRATHNLARNVAKTIRESSLPDPSAPAPAQTSGSSGVAVASVAVLKSDAN